MKCTRLSSLFLVSCVARSVAFCSRQKLPSTNARMVPRRLTVEDAAPYSNVKGIIWDVDGTLADSWKLGYDATLVVLKQNGVEEPSEAEYHEGTRYCTPERLARHAGKNPCDDDFDAVGQKLGEEFDNLYVDLVNMDTAGFYPGISALLNGIPQDVSLGALTNACVNYAHAVLKTNCPVTNGDFDSEKAIYSRFRSGTCAKVSLFQFQDLYSNFIFGAVRGADNVPTPKPSPDGLFEVCKDLQLAPKDCIYIGDSPSDGAAAKAAGMKAIGVLWGSHPEEKLRQAPFDHLCSTVEELQALMPTRR